jgi:hypothetical protein
MNNNKDLITLYEAASYLGYRNVNSVVNLIKNGFLNCYPAPSSSKKMVCFSELSALAVPDWFVFLFHRIRINFTISPFRCPFPSVCIVGLLSFYIVGILSTTRIVSWFICTAYLQKKFWVFSLSNVWRSNSLRSKLLHKHLTFLVKW